MEGTKFLFLLLLDQKIKKNRGQRVLFIVEKRFFELTMSKNAASFAMGIVVYNFK